MIDGIHNIVLFDFLCHSLPCPTNSIEKNQAFLTGADDRAVNDDVGFQAIPWDICQQLQRLSRTCKHTGVAHCFNGDPPPKKMLRLLKKRIYVKDC